MIPVKTACESRCIFCEESGVLEIDDEREFRRIGAVIDKVDLSEVLVIEIGGRDPLSFGYLGRVVSLLRAKGVVDVFVQTTGLGLKDKGLLASLIRSGVTGFRIPLYGSAGEIHDVVTGISGSFTELLSALDNLRDCPERMKVYLHSLMLKGNYEDIASLANFVMKRYPDMSFEVRLLEPLPSWKAERYRSLSPTYGELVGPLMRAIREYGDRYPASSERFRTFAKVLFSIPPCVIVSNVDGVDKARLSRIYSDVVFHVTKRRNEMASKKFLKPTESCPDCDLSGFCQGIPDRYADLVGIGEFGRKQMRRNGRGRARSADLQ